MVMDEFSRLLDKLATRKEFEYHWRCKASKITHHCFVDDLILFCKVDIKGVKITKEALDYFHNWSGLKANHYNNNIFLSSVSNDEKASISGILNFEVGTLPLKYLGVLMVSTKLFKENCKVLTEKIIERITSWISKSLTYAERLTLVKAIPFSIQIYWSSIFFLPAKILNDIDASLRTFFWAGVDMNKHKAKVA